MRYCECCGAPRISTITRGGLVLTDQPPSALWKGKRLRLQRADLTVLFELCRWKQISSDRIFALAPLGEEGLEVGAVHERMRRIRRALEAAGCPHRIVSVYGWGYRLDAM